jgi:O-antigen/teichoic acid export membrane protein
MNLKKEIIKNSGWVLLARVLGAIVGLLFYSFITRILTQDDVGTYFIVFSISTMLSVVVGLGLPKTITRMIAEVESGKGELGTRQLVYRSLRLTLYSSAIGGVGYTFYVNDFLRKYLFDFLENPLFIPCIVAWLSLLAFRLLIAESFRGLGDIKSASLFGVVVSNCVAVTLLVGIYYGGHKFELNEIIGLNLIGLAVSCTVGVLLLFRATKGSGQSTILKDRDLLLLSFPIMISELAQVIIARSNTWILGAVSSGHEVAIYGTSLQLMVLVSFPFLVVNNAIPQIVVKLNVTGESKRLEKLLQTISTLMMVPAILTVLIMGLFGGDIMAIVFGEAYRGGHITLILLALGQLINVAMGPCATTLIMTGNQKILMRITVLVGCLSVAIALPLAEIYGAVGAAFAAAIGLAVQNILVSWQVKRKVGIKTYASLSVLKAKDFSIRNIF